MASFDSATTGAYPFAGLSMDAAGNLYGTTQSGGTNNAGTVFELPHGSSTLAVLASFNSTNGANPYAGLVVDGSGDLFGATYGGGANGAGTVFELAQGSSTIPGEPMGHHRVLSR